MDAARLQDPFGLSFSSNGAMATRFVTTIKFKCLRPMPPTPSLRNLDFGSNMAVLGSGRDLNGRGAPVGSIWAEFQLKRSHGDPFRDQNHDFVRPVPPGC